MFRKGGNSISTDVGNRRRVHTTWEDDSELIEEYDLKTSELLLRKRRKPKPLGAQGDWEYLQGEEAAGYKAPAVQLMENSQNVRTEVPCIGARGSRHMCWRCDHRCCQRSRQSILLPANMHSDTYSRSPCRLCQYALLHSVERGPYAATVHEARHREVVPVADTQPAVPCRGLLSNNR